MHRLSLMFFATAALFAISAEAADRYPSKPVRMLVGLPAGSSLDVCARTVSNKLAEALQQNVVVDNRAGAAGNIAAEIAAHGTADGGAVPAALAVGATRERFNAPF